jgi:hypothetical protein
MRRERIRCDFVVYFMLMCVAVTPCVYADELGFTVAPIYTYTIASCYGAAIFDKIGGHKECQSKQFDDKRLNAYFCTPPYHGWSCRKNCVGYYFVPAKDPIVCNGNGACVTAGYGIGSCVCNATYTGKYCEIDPPNEIYSLNTCTGHGVVAPSKVRSCLCNHNKQYHMMYTGSVCQNTPWTACMSEENMQACEDGTGLCHSMLCNSHGKCTVDGCTCTVGYTGKYCEDE